MFRHVEQCDLIKNAWAVGVRGLLWRQWTQTNDGNQAAATRESCQAMSTSSISKGHPSVFFLGEEGGLRAQNDSEELCVASKGEALETSNTSLVSHFILPQEGKGAFGLKY